MLPCDGADAGPANRRRRVTNIQTLLADFSLRKKKMDYPPARLRFLL